MVIGHSNSSKVFDSSAFLFHLLLITMQMRNFFWNHFNIKETTAHSHKKEKKSEYLTCSPTLLFEANLLLDSSSFFNRKVSILIEGRRTHWMVKTLFHLHAMHGIKKAAELWIEAFKKEDKNGIERALYTYILFAA